MDQSITSGKDSINNQVGTINNYYLDSSKSKYNLSDKDSRKKFFTNCVTEIINSEKIEIISVRQLKTKLALEVLQNCAISDYNYSLEDLLPAFNDFLQSEIFKKEEGYKLSIV
jgi:hypothetical protein